jgi:ferric-dicitrate binding protein FerR (iron transport regulator)
MKMEEYFKASQIIANSIACTITPGEQQWLDEWLAKSAKNRVIYSNLLDNGQREEERRLIATFQQQTAWQKMTFQMQRLHRKTFTKFYAFAASVAAVAIIASVIFFGIDRSTEDVPQIMPGSDKALLTLADGRVVELSDSKIEIDELGVLVVNNTVSYTDAGATLDYNVLTTPKGGEFKLRLNDGSLVHLNAESRLRFPVAFFGDKRVVELSGEAWFEITENAKMPFIVKTNRGDITVLGTSFNIKSYEDESESYTTLVTGKVSLDYTGQSVTLTPGKQAVVSDAGDITTRSVDVWEYIGWKDGVYRFSGRSVRSIMTELERWYDFQTIYENESLETLKFTGNLRRRETIEYFLELLARTDEVEFRIEGRTVVLRGVKN